MNNKTLAAGSLAVGLLSGFVIGTQAIRPQYIAVPGPTVYERVEVPGPVETIEVPGPTQIVTLTEQVEVIPEGCIEYIDFLEEEEAAAQEAVRSWLRGDATDDIFDTLAKRISSDIDIGGTSERVVWGCR